MSFSLAHYVAELRDIQVVRRLNLELKRDVWLDMSPMTNDPAWGTDEDDEVRKWMKGESKKRALNEVLRRL